MKNNYPCVIVIKNFLNPKVHQNCISGSKVSAFLLKGWILPTGGSSAVHKTFVSLIKFNKTTATFRWPLSSMCSHMSLQIITGKILLLYVFAYVSSDDHFREILPNTPCKKKSISYGCVAICVFRLLPCSNSAPHSVQLKAFRAIFYYVHFTLVTSMAQFTHKIIVTLCAQGALIGVAGLLVLGESLS